MANRYWVGGSGNWEDTAHWAIEDGGVGGASVPGVDDVVYIYDSSDIVVTSSTPISVSELTITTFTANTTFNLGGSLTASGNIYIDSNNDYITTFNANGNTITCSLLTFYHDTVSNLDECTINVNGDGEGSGGLLFNAAPEISALSSTINVHDGQLATENIYLPTVKVFGTYALIYYSNHIGQLTFDSNEEGPATYLFSGEVGNITQSVTTLIVNTSAGSPITFMLDPDSGDLTPWILSISSGTISLEYCTLVDSTAEGGATFNALISDSCVDGGGNTGWNFGAGGEPIPVVHTFSEITGNNIGIYLMSGDRDLLYATDIIDFNLSSAIKTIEGIDIGGSFDDKTSVEVMIAWRNNKRTGFRDTTWKRVSPEGFCVPLVSGVEFIVYVRMSPCEEVELNTITAHVKVTDKRFIRGMYLNTGGKE